VQFKSGNQDPPLPLLTVLIVCREAGQWSAFRRCLSGHGGNLLSTIRKGLKFGERALIKLSLNGIEGKETLLQPPNGPQADEMFLGVRSIASSKDRWG
jgi:hypothetical protein